MNSKESINTIEAGVVGLGLMGTSIIVSLLVAGHKVMAIAPLADDLLMTSSRIHEQLTNCKKLGLLNASIGYYKSRLNITEDYTELSNCDLVVECVIENIDIKASVYKKIATEVRHETVIASNTSAIAISILQKLVPLPERFMGIHWAEPAYATRFLEITCGADTSIECAEWIFTLAYKWGKEPTLLRKDIRGFIANRLMYAVYREIFHLVDKGQTSIEDADKAFRYDAGSWMTLMGIFRRMDLMGLPDCASTLRAIFPVLSNAATVPTIMKEMVDRHGRGIHNLVGLYSYSATEAKAWEEAFVRFNKEIYQLAASYGEHKQSEPCEA